MRVAVVDSGGANTASVCFAFERLGVAVELTGDATRIRSADRVVLPGVGAAAPAMARLRELALITTLRELQQPVLGICLGMQLLFESSEEGDVACLGLLPGRVRRMPTAPGLRVPHMGWNRLLATGSPHRLSDDVAGAQVYFVHSFAAPITGDCLASSVHGEAFAAMVQRRNVMGTQFHPERSGSAGARVLKNFLQGQWA